MRLLLLSGRCSLALRVRQPSVLQRRQHVLDGPGGRLVRPVQGIRLRAEQGADPQISPSTSCPAQPSAAATGRERCAALLEHRYMSSHRSRSGGLISVPCRDRVRCVPKQIRVQGWRKTAVFHHANLRRLRPAMLRPSLCCRCFGHQLKPEAAVGSPRDQPDRRSDDTVSETGAHGVELLRSPNVEAFKCHRCAHRSETASEPLLRRIIDTCSALHCLPRGLERLAFAI
jgi:hypothetical protein